MIARRLGGGLLIASRFLSINVLSMICGMMVWAVVPLIFGWSAHTVASGSMSPKVKVGDILVSGPVKESELKPGMVAVFNDPSEPGRVLSHRIQAVEDGHLITKGDANPTQDTAEVPIENLIGVAKLNVPKLGYPGVWFGQQRYDLVVLTLAGLIAMCLLAMSPPRRPGELQLTLKPGPIPVRRRTPRKSSSSDASIPDQRVPASSEPAASAPAEHQVA
ncbi:signal peptidase I [Kineosporia babensis]|uniref:Signal peptidase I n=1 Tax=Kineosporia babensis TaxID=499548 RepID=A0A9X1NBX2_9ACTN|nr:signal peptidase I [Kineosporia babensis]MCD5311270.1 signal peptidase I [Kineosporia babensis]